MFCKNVFTNERLFQYKKAVGNGRRLSNTEERRRTRAHRVRFVVSALFVCLFVCLIERRQ